MLPNKQNTQSSSLEVSSLLGNRVNLIQCKCTCFYYTLQHWKIESRNKGFLLKANRQLTVLLEDKPHNPINLSKISSEILQHAALHISLCSVSTGNTEVMCSHTGVRICVSSDNIYFLSLSYWINKKFRFKI